jgi:hypothetical protein
LGEEERGEDRGGRRGDDDDVSRVRAAPLIPSMPPSSSSAIDREKLATMRRGRGAASYQAPRPCVSTGVDGWMRGMRLCARAAFIKPRVRRCREESGVGIKRQSNAKRGGGLLFVVVSRRWHTTQGVGGGRMTTTAITTAIIRGQQRQRGDDGDGNGRGGIIVPRPRPAPPSHARRASPPHVIVV